MTILQHTGAAAGQRTAMINLLVQADRDGLEVAEHELLALGGNHARERLREVKRCYPLGESERDGETYYSLEASLVQGAGRASDTAGPPSANDSEASRPFPSPSVASSPSTLFDPAEPPRQHWEDGMAA